MNCKEKLNDQNPLSNFFLSNFFLPQPLCPLNPFALWQSPHYPNIFCSLAAAATSFEHFFLSFASLIVLVVKWPSSLQWSGPVRSSGVGIPSMVKARQSRDGTVKQTWRLVLSAATRKKKRPVSRRWGNEEDLPTCPDPPTCPDLPTFEPLEV